MGHAGAVIAGGKGTAADKFKALDKAGARTVKSPADLGKAMAEQLAKHRAKPVKKPVGPNVLIIEPNKKGKRLVASNRSQKGTLALARKAAKPAKKKAAARKKSSKPARKK
jgi:succinyl-CoA synthetase alpha subunit